LLGALRFSGHVGASRLPNPVEREMIEDPPLLTVRRRFPRPNAKQLAAFRGAMTGHVVDAMEGRGALHHGIKPVSERTSFCGPALTCEAGPGDCLAVFGALEEAKPGDVILCATDAFRDTSCAGDLVVGMMKNKGVAAFVTDGLVRDTPGIRAVGLPCFAAGVTPNSPAKTGPGKVGLPVVVGGVAVSSGDIVLADEDGVVVVPYPKIAETIRRLATVRALEADLEAKVKAGLVKPDFYDRMIPSARIREVD
jgi:4-hydroxy-4-methyl-2-oxoglutarate aldolase